MTLGAKLLATAMHPNTPDAEALAALRKLGLQINKVGGVERAFGFVPPVAQPHLSFNDKRRHDNQVQVQLEEANQRVEKLERALTAARATIEEQEYQIKLLKESLSDRSRGTMTFIEFSNKARIILGTSRWVAEFCRQTGTSEKVMTRARVSGTAMKSLVEQLPRLKPVVPHGNGKRIEFSVAEVKEVRKWATKLSDSELSQKATMEFGRVITEGHITKLRSNLKNQTGGYTDPAYGGALPSRLGRGGARRGHFAWENFPDLELHIAKEFLAGTGPAALARHASQVTGFDISPNQVTQRVYNTNPPKRLISAPQASGPLTWAEVWLIGLHVARRGQKDRIRGWLSPALKMLGLDPVQRSAFTGNANLLRKSLIGTSLDHLDPALVQAFRQSYWAGSKQPPRPRARANLTRRERQVVLWLSEGKSIKDMSSTLKIAHRTIEAFIQSAMDKLGATSVDDLFVKFTVSQAN